MSDANQPSESPSSPRFPETAPPSASSSPVPIVDFATLAGNGHEVQIRLGTEYYRLRLTRNGRLILNK